MLCEYCKNEFNPTRSDARFCSANCKLKFNRAKVDEEPVIDTDEQVKVVLEGLKNESKVNDKWGDVCSVEEWRKYPAMCENKAQAKALCELYSAFTAQQLVDNGIRPPEWKRNYATYKEAMTALNKTMEDLGFTRERVIWVIDKKEDYSKWK